MPEPLTLAFLGCGRITTRHARTLAGLDRGVRCRFASRDAARAAEFNQLLKGSGSYGSYEDAISDSSVDAVVIATPPDQHLPLALAALSAGRHVIIEKPAFLRAADADQVRKAASRAGRQALVAENYHYRPLLRVLRDLIASDAIGELRLVHLDAVKLQDAPSWLRDDMPGALWEGGIHWVHFLAQLDGGVKRVAGFRPGPPDSPERTMLVTATLGSGAAATLAYSWETPSPLRGLRMSHCYGTRGVIAFETNGLFVRVSGARNRLRLPGFRDISGFKAMWLDFLSALRGERTASMTLDLAQRDLALVELAYHSAANAAATEG
jgi:UDP-N-acetylglucosamine 3-dehydrogenase